MIRYLYCGASEMQFGAPSYTTTRDHLDLIYLANELQLHNVAVAQIPALVNFFTSTADHQTALATAYHFEELGDQNTCAKDIATKMLHVLTTNIRSNHHFLPMILRDWASSSSSSSSSSLVRRSRPVDSDRETTKRARTCV